MLFLEETPVTSFVTNRHLAPSLALNSSLANIHRCRMNNLFDQFYFDNHKYCFIRLPRPYLRPHSSPRMSWFQKTFSLKAQSRGSYLITSEVTASLPEISEYKVGLLNLFVQHTSCALSLNENWDSDVRLDMRDALDRIVVEDKKNEGIYRHDAEGSDDMPAHVKSSLIGASVTIPITDGRLNLGTWQGIYYMEFRTSKHRRNVVATIQGEKRD
ncbi:hypothetical protein ABW19_dt0201370 [Dactylella cylindrospora]|nr:hypothetical protein ABW19_dt0201370 [Dactylella cylindrospora]